ncbi:MAG: molecular chaperone [Thermodesulfobacteriota bacterium]
MISALRGGLAGLVLILAPMALALLPADAFAAGFDVAPTRVFIGAGKKTAVLEVTNSGDKVVALQLRAVRWEQGEDGKNDFEETKDIIFFPKITRVKSGETRTIRVGYQGGAAAREKTYRVFIEELASSRAAGGGLGFTIRLSVPIFITPPKVVVRNSLERVELSQGKALLTLKNNGTVHAVVRKVAVSALDGDAKEVFRKEISGWYVLAGDVRTYAIDLPREECLKAGTIKGVLEVGESVLERQVEVDSSQCRSEE